MVTIRQVKYGQGHRYFVEGDERVDPELPLVSCSTIARYTDTGGDGLLIWAADHALATGSRYGFKDASDKAIAIGNSLHAEISQHISTGKQPAKPSALFGSWYSSMQELGIKWLATELMVYHPDLLYAGQCDAIGIVDDEVTLFDWKTTDQYRYPKKDDGSLQLDKDGNPRRIKKQLGQKTHAAQLGGYWFAMASQGNKEIPLPTRLAVCYVLKDTLKVEWRYVSPERASRAFAAAYGVYKATRENLYEK